MLTFVSKLYSVYFWLIEQPQDKVKKQKRKLSHTQRERERKKNNLTDVEIDLLGWKPKWGPVHMPSQIALLSQLCTAARERGVWHLFHFQIKYCFSKAWPIFPLYFYHLLKSDEQASGFQEDIPSCLLQMFALETCKELMTAINGWLSPSVLSGHYGCMLPFTFSVAWFPRCDTGQWCSHNFATQCLLMSTSEIILLRWPQEGNNLKLQGIFTDEPYISNIHDSTRLLLSY